MRKLMNQKRCMLFIRIGIDDNAVIFGIVEACGTNQFCVSFLISDTSFLLPGGRTRVYLENRTDEALMFSASDVAVNGYMCDPYWAVEVAPGKRCNSHITWSETDLAYNGITQVESITLPIRVYDSEDWLEGEILRETFTITP